MIESVINTPVTLTSNSSNVIFTVDDYRSRSANCDCNCNSWLQHTQGSPLYKILKGGTYEIDLSVVATSGTAGIVALGLYQDGSNKLTEEEVKEIYLSDLGCTTLSKKYNVSKTNIRYIKNKQQWKWLTDKLDVQIQLLPPLY